MSDLEEAQLRFDKVDGITRKLALIFVIFLIFMIGFLTYEVVTVQNTIAKNQISNAEASTKRFKNYQIENAKQHQKTQQYIRCISQVLLLPLESRNNAAFDKCSQNQ